MRGVRREVVPGRVRAVNVFRKVWLAAKVKAALGGDMDSLQKVLGWLFKSKWAQGHRRQIGAALTVGTAVVTLAAGPIAGVIPALAAPAVQHALLLAASYFNVVGTVFANDPAPAPAP